MATYEFIDSVVDAMISRIQTNITTLGGTSSTPVTEGDELPERVTIFPSIFIIPLIEGGDQMETKPGGVKNVFHDFTITVVGLYKATTVSELMRTTRQYGYTLADLFSNENYKVNGTKGGAQFLFPRVQPAYYRVGDKIIHSWSVRFKCKSVTR